MEENLSQQVQFEQAAEAVKGFAVVLAGYYKALKKEGFTHSEALELVIAYQTQMLGRKP